MGRLEGGGGGGGGGVVGGGGGHSLFLKSSEFYCNLSNLKDKLIKNHKDLSVLAFSRQIGWSVGVD